MTKNKLGTVLAALLLGCSLAHAQNGVRPAYQYPEQPSGSGPAAVQIGNTPMFFTPWVGFSAGEDTNLFMTPNNERSSAYYVTGLGFKVDARGSNAVLQASYQGQYGRYSDSEPDNYIDHFWRAQLDTAIDRRNFFRLGIDHTRGHDPRGSTDRPLTANPDRYRLTVPYATYAFGAPGAAGRVEVYGSLQDRHYLNNRENTFAADRKTEEFGGAFYWRVAPRTYALFEARRTNISYRDPGSLLSADERRYYVGLSWEATAATTGTVKIGQVQRKPDSGAPDFTDTSWEALVSWSPRTYSKFDFYSSRMTNESSGLGNFIVSDATGVVWTHSWSSVLSTGVDLRYQRDAYQGFDRTDDVKVLGLKVGYKFRRWLNLGAEYTYTQRDSNQPSFEYDRSLYLLTATASL